MTERESAVEHLRNAHPESARTSEGFSLRLVGRVLWWVTLPMMLLPAVTIWLCVKVFGKDRVVRFDRWLGRLHQAIRP